MKFFISDKHPYNKANYYPDDMSHIIHASYLNSFFNI